MPLVLVRLKWRAKQKQPGPDAGGRGTGLPDQAPLDGPWWNHLMNAGVHMNIPSDSTRSVQIKNSVGD